MEQAYKALKEAKRQDRELFNEYKQKSNDLINPCKEKIKECLNARSEAIKEFNNNFGVYTTTYTGDKALQEFGKFVDLFSNLFI